jgi:choline dehydrogenase
MSGAKDWSADYVIVGAGSAGCVLANRLSADPAVRVILLEAGVADRDPSLHVPGAIVRNVANPAFNWNYYTQPQKHLAGRELFWPRGKVLGGSSSINGMLYVRGDRVDYDGWAKAGCDGWSYAEVLPYFRRSESSDRGGGEFHGRDGPLRVTTGAPRTPICSAFVEAAVDAGFPSNDDFNGATQEGFGHFDCTIHSGRRWSTATAFLRPVRQRANLKVLPNAMVSRLQIEQGCARGVVARIGGAEVTITAGREVILCGGTINSPQLLMLSGIGPAEHLESVGVRVQADLPGVGGNLQDHVAFKFHVECQEPVTAFKYLHPWHALRAGMAYTFGRTGVLAHTALPTGGFFRTQEGLEAPDIQVHVAIGLVPDHGRKLPDRHGFTVYVNQGRPASRGTIRLRSADAAQAPLIDPGYLSDPGDMQVLLRGIDAVRSILERPALRPYVSSVMVPGPEVAAQDGMEALIRERAISVYHPVGTCAMGEGADRVVDARLRVRGVGQLRVVDASVMPTLMNGNTNAPTIMIAERAADLIRDGA